MRFLAALLPLALALVACGDCDCGKQAPAAAAGSSKAEAEATPPASAGALEATEPEPPKVATMWRGEGTTLELSVWHMRCAGCEKRVEDALKALAGVQDALATNADSKVVVTLADASGREALKPLIRETLAALDFRVLGE